jgi:hypothetical protein
VPYLSRTRPCIDGGPAIEETLTLQLVRAFVAKLNAHQADGLYELMTPTTIAASMPSAVQGRDVVCQAWRAYFTQVLDYRIACEQVLSGVIPLPSSAQPVAPLVRMGTWTQCSAGGGTGGVESSRSWNQGGGVARVHGHPPPEQHYGTGGSLPWKAKRSVQTVIRLIRKWYESRWYLLRASVGMLN